MAKNLRAKIPAADTLIIRDVNEEATKRFVAEAQEAARSADENRVEIAQSAREVAEKSVSVMLHSDM
jgi:3-hydroxyisobutyrate dehydrogenase